MLRAVSHESLSYRPPYSTLQARAITAKALEALSLPPPEEKEVSDHGNDMSDDDQDCGNLASDALKSLFGGQQQAEPQGKRDGGAPPTKKSSKGGNCRGMRRVSSARSVASVGSASVGSGTSCPTRPSREVTPKSTDSKSRMTAASAGPAARPALPFKDVVVPTSVVSVQPTTSAVGVVDGSAQKKVGRGRPRLVDCTASCMALKAGIAAELQKMLSDKDAAYDLSAIDTSLGDAKDQKFLKEEVAARVKRIQGALSIASSLQKKISKFEVGKDPEVDSARDIVSGFQKDAEAMTRILKAPEERSSLHCLLEFSRKLGMGVCLISGVSDLMMLMPPSHVVCHIVIRVAALFFWKHVLSFIVRQTGLIAFTAYHSQTPCFAQHCNVDVTRYVTNHVCVCVCLTVMFTS